MKTFPALFAFVIMAPMLRAEPPPPSGALLNHAPEMASWVITSYPADSSAAADSPAAPGAKLRKKERSRDDATAPTQRITVTKSGGILHMQIEDKQAGASEKWCRGEIQVTTRQDWQKPVVSVPGDRYDTAYVDFAKSDFPDVNWISRKNFVGIKKLLGRVCLVFQDRLAVNSEDRSASPNASAQAVEVTACIDYYSRLPVSATRGGMNSDYQFDLPPNAGQVLPPAVEKAIDEHQKRLGALSPAPQ